MTYTRSFMRLVLVSTLAISLQSCSGCTNSYVFDLEVGPNVDSTLTVEYTTDASKGSLQTMYVGSGIHNLYNTTAEKMYDQSRLNVASYIKSIRIKKGDGIVFDSQLNGGGRFRSKPPVWDYSERFVKFQGTFYYYRLYVGQTSITYTFELYNQTNDSLRVVYSTNTFKDSTILVGTQLASSKRTLYIYKREDKTIAPDSKDVGVRLGEYITSIRVTTTGGKVLYNETPAYFSDWRYERERMGYETTNVIGSGGVQAKKVNITYTLFIPTH